MGWRRRLALGPPSVFSQCAQRGGAESKSINPEPDSFSPSPGSGSDVGGCQMPPKRPKDVNQFANAIMTAERWVGDRQKGRESPLGLIFHER
jgi:hypothetical protein